MSFVFLKTDDNGAVGVRVNDNEADWMTLAGKFREFLLGCGYIFGDEDEENFDDWVTRGHI